MDEVTDFADSAALIANLDLVISVDAAMAHLAGALGKPVWMLDRFNPDRRWLTGDPIVHGILRFGSTVSHISATGTLS